MKTIFLVLLFGGLVAHNKGLREEDDAEDNDLGRKGVKKSTISYSYASSRFYVTQLATSFRLFYQNNALKRAKRLHSSLVKDWDKQPEKERKERTIAVKAAADNIGPIKNAKHDTTDTYAAVLNLMKTLRQLKSPNGHIDSIPAMFTSSCMNLLSETLENFPLTIVYLEISKVMAIRKYREQDIDYSTLQTTKYFWRFSTIVNSNEAGNNDKISQNEAERTKAVIKKLFQNHFAAIVNLKAHMIRMIRDDKADDAKKYLAYAELYIKLEIITQMLLTHTISLIPDNSTSVFTYIQSLLDTTKKNSHHYVNILHSHNLQNQFMAYYDPQIYKAINAYLTIQLGLPTRDDFPGFSCISLEHGKMWKWRWFKLPGMSYPYFGGGGGACKWRIVSHGYQLYSIVNKYGCPYGDWCDAMLSFDGFNPAPVTVETNDPVLWEIRYDLQRRHYTIKTARFCGTKCNCYLGYGPRTIQQTEKAYVGRLDCTTQHPRYWKIFKSNVSSFDMVTGSGSAATNQLEENQEDNSVSGDMAVDPSADQDNEDNNSNDENKNEIPEKIQPETTEQANQDSNGDEIED